jgi:hypothetical protein
MSAPSKWIRGQEFSLSQLTAVSTALFTVRPDIFDDCVDMLQFCCNDDAETIAGVTEALVPILQGALGPATSSTLSGFGGFHHTMSPITAASAPSMSGDLGRSPSLEAAIRAADEFESQRKRAMEQQDMELAAQLYREEQQARQAETESRTYQCSICILSYKIGDMITLSCDEHRYCRECFVGYCNRCRSSAFF